MPVPVARRVVFLLLELLRTKSQHVQRTEQWPKAFRLDDRSATAQPAHRRVASAARARQKARSEQQQKGPIIMCPTLEANRPFVAPAIRVRTPDTISDALRLDAAHPDYILLRLRGVRKFFVQRKTRKRPRGSAIQPMHDPALSIPRSHGSTLRSSQQRSPCINFLL